MTQAVILVAAVLVAGWVLLNLKTGRSDGTLLKTHPFRTMLGYLMPTRNGSVVYFDTAVKADNLLAFIDKTRESYHCDMTHCLVAAAGFGLAENPKMNRFVVGRRLYQRKGIFVTFSAKRKKMGREAKLAAIKLDLSEPESFEQLARRINVEIGVERSDQVTYTDKELNLVLFMPRAVLRLAIRLFYWLDYHNILPGSFIKADGMYTSMFIANLGSVQMGAGFHHLYEWGTCPLFMMVGEIEERPMVVDGQVVPQKILPVRWSYDERIDDGLNARFGIDSVKRALEDPDQYLAQLGETVGLARKSESMHSAA